MKCETVSESWQRDQRKRRGGFTLWELLLVLAILVILGAIVVPQFFTQQRKAERDAALAQIRNLETALKLYRFNMGDYPSTDEGIAALYTEPASDTGNRWSGPYLDEKILQDPWGRAYNYEWRSQKLNTKPAIWSVGPDGQEGSEDDVTNWAELQQ